MDIQKNSFLSIDQLANQYLNNSRKTVKAAQENLVSFQEILQSKSNEQMKFSKHATVRLADRGIELTDAQLERLNDGAQKAGQKGIRDSLVIVDNLAFSSIHIQFADDFFYFNFITYQDRIHKS